MVFVDKKILPDSETVGDQLKTKREQLGLDINTVAGLININKEYLLALENGSFEKLPEGMYGQIFFNKYADFLKLNTAKLKNEFKKESKNIKRITKDTFNPNNKVKKFDLVLLPKIVKNLIIATFIIIFFIYIGSYLVKSLSSPQIEIIAPPDNFITSDNSVNIIGQTNNKTLISINDKSILINENGSFEYTIDLKRGVNIITIVAKKKYGQEKIIKKQILVE